MLTDTHCHIFSNDYTDINKLLQEANVNKVTRFFNNATDKESIIEVLNLVKKYPHMYAAIGYHPEVVAKVSNDDLKFLEQNLIQDKVIAIGEIGLDYYYTKDNKKEQIELLEKQLEIAEKYKMPVIIHNREATLDIINSLKKYKVKGVIHCFNGSEDTANIFIKMGFLLGINGVITFKNCKLKEVIKNISIKNIVLETDCPYLTPEPFRGKENEPKYIKNIAEFVSEIYKIPVSQVEKITNENIKRIFDI